jgi:hypothetical protein
VGLSVEDQAIQLGAKRKCRQNIDSYREPTDSIRSIFGSKSAAYITDSEDDNDSNDGGKRKKSKKSNEIVLVPADFTPDNLTNLSLALVNMGYLSWDAVRMSSKVYWKNTDIAKACRHIILFLFLASSIQNEGNSKTGKKTVENKNGSEEMEVDNDNNEKNDNDDGDENNDETAETTENNNVESKEANSTDAIPVEGTSEKPGGYKFDVKAGKSYLTKYKGLKLALKSYLESKQEVEEETVPVEDLLIQNHIQELKSLLPSADKMEVEDEQLTLKKMKETFDKDFTVDFENHLEAVFEKLSQDEIVKALLQEEKDLNKMAKKTNMRAKLAQVEDLFESKIFSMMASEFLKVEEPQVVPAEPTEAQEALTTTTNTEAEEPKATDPIVKFELKIDYEFLAKELELFGFVDCPLWWNTKCDSYLLVKSSHAGCPDGKRRFLHFLSNLKMDKEHLRGEARVEDIVDTTSEEEKMIVDESPVTTTEPPSSSEGTAEVKTEAPEVQYKEICDEAIEKLSNKFVLQRFKLLTKMLRVEPNLAAEKAEQAARKAELVAQKAAERAAEKAQKVAQQASQAAEKAEKQAQLFMKKNVLQVLKTIQRVGYPRTTYLPLLNADVSSAFFNKQYLLTWEDLLQEITIELGATSCLTTKEVEDICYEAIRVYNLLDTEEYKGKENVGGSGVLQEVSLKLIEQSFEKTDLIHQIRLLLAVHSEADIIELIKNNCKITGPTIPNYKRDTNMPVWWTQKDHDISLLKLSIVNGCASWKKVSTDPLMTMPEDYVIPSKVNGQEWITQATPKALEKRIMTLLRGMPAMKTYTTLVTPSSPQKKASKDSKNVIQPQMKGITSMWFNQQKAVSILTSTAKITVDSFSPSTEEKKEEILATPTPTAQVVVEAIDLSSEEKKSEESPVNQPTVVATVVDDDDKKVSKIAPRDSSV